LDVFKNIYAVIIAFNQTINEVIISLFSVTFRFLFYAVLLFCYVNIFEQIKIA